MNKIIVGVMGPGEKATSQNVEDAYQLGKLIAQNGWVLLSGGGKLGVMGAVNKGAKEAGGLTVGILPTDDPAFPSLDLDIPIVTNLRSARNYINVLSSDVVIACGMNHGTASEVALAIKPGKKVILLRQDKTTKAFFKKIGGGQIYFADTPIGAVELMRQILKKLTK